MVRVTCISKVFTQHHANTGNLLQKVSYNISQKAGQEVRGSLGLSLNN